MRQDRTNPFPGLRSFDVDENELFFGRADQIDELLSRLRQTRFTAVVGTSGSGKSSLVRAGLLPALKRGLMADTGSRWRIVLFRPINDPIGNLTQALQREGVFPGKTTEEQQASFIEEALRRSSLGLIDVMRQSQMKQDENLLIVVDQFEELFRFEETFTSENPADEAAAFVKLLLRATANQRELPIYLVLTMRSDYLGESARFKGLPEAINAGQYLVPRMNDDERRLAITAPVAIGGALITEPLVNRLLNDVGDDPGKLPLLQHAVMRTWEKWESDGKQEGYPLGIPSYEEIGGLTGALSQHADEVYDALSPREKLVAEKVFKALTAKGPDGRGIRSPQKFSDLCAIAATKGLNGTEADVRNVINSFRQEGRSFLMPPPRDVEKPDEDVPLLSDTLIDISHESLIQGWDRLRDWVEDEADSARVYQRLAEHAVLFDKGDEKRLTPPGLPVFLKWRDETQRPNEAWARRYFNPDWAPLFNEGGSETSKYKNEFERAGAFLNDSETAHNANVAIKQKAAKQRVRRLAYTAGAFALLALFATAAAGVAGVQWKRANTALVVANEERRNAVSARLRAEIAEKDTKEQLIETEIAKTEAEEQRENAEMLEAAAHLAQSEAETQRDAATKSAQAAMVSRQQAEVALFEAQQNREEAVKQAQLVQSSLKEANRARVDAVAASKEAATQRDLAKSRLEEANKQRLRAEIALNNADNTLATLKNVDSQTRHLNAISRQDNPIETAVFGSDSNRAFISNGQDAFLLELRTGSLQFSKSDFQDVARLSYKLKNETNLGVHLNGLLSPATQEMLKKYETSNEPEPALADALVNDFNALLKGPTIYKKSAFRDVKLRRETADLLSRNPQGADLVRLNRMLIEDVYPLEIASIDHFNVTHDYSHGHWNFSTSPDAKLIAAKYDDTQIDIFNNTGAVIEKKGCDECRIGSVAFSPSGKYVWSIGKKTFDDTNDVVLFWEANATEDDPRQLDVKSVISQALFSPDDGRLAMTSPGSTEIQIWDVAKATKIFSLEETDKLSNGDYVSSDVDQKMSADPPSLVNSISYSTDGRFIVATFKNHKNVWVWDAATGKRIRTLEGHRCQVNSAEFDFDGKQIVAAGDDGSAIVWDAQSGKTKFELRGYRGLLIYRSERGIHQFFPIPQLFRFDLKPKEGEFVPLNSAKFSRNGKMVVTTSVDGKVRVWTLNLKGITSNQTLLLPGYTGNVRSAEFSPDNKFVIAAGEDGAARIWDIGDGKPDKDASPKSCKDASKLRAANTKR